MKVEQYREEYASFNEGFLREFYLHYSGQKPALDLGPIYERHRGLFSLESIAGLRQHLSETSEHFETTRASLRHLLTFAINNFLEAQVESLTEQVSGQEASATVEWDGRVMTFQETAIAVANQADRALRNDLFQTRASMIRASNDLRAERLSKLHEASRSIGPIESPIDSAAAPRTDNSAGAGRQQDAALHREAQFSGRNDASLYQDLLGLD